MLFGWLNVIVGPHVSNESSRLTPTQTHNTQQHTREHTWHSGRCVAAFALSIRRVRPQKAGDKSDQRKGPFNLTFPTRATTFGIHTHTHTGGHTHTAYMDIHTHT